jgi:AraC family transcriptional regulator
MNSNFHNSEAEYISKVLQIANYIAIHYTKKITIEELSKVSGFSEIHIKDIFENTAGNTLNEYLIKIRIDKAAELLIRKQDWPLSYIAVECGFVDVYIFSRAFKQQSGICVTSFRKQYSNCNNNPNIDFFHKRILSEKHTKEDSLTIDQSFCVEVKYIKSITVAYIRYGTIDFTKKNLTTRLWNSIDKWITRKRVNYKTAFKYVVIHQGEDERVLSTTQCILLGAIIPNDYTTKGIVGKKDLYEGKYLVIKANLTSEEVPKVWKWVYKEWFPKSGYQPENEPRFELYSKIPNEEKQYTELFMPLKPLSN